MGGVVGQALLLARTHELLLGRSQDTLFVGKHQPDDQEAEVPGGD
jgi:hypothetical protein